MQLTQLIDRLSPLTVSGEVADRRVGGVVFDSRKSAPGVLFVAVAGTRVDGHRYIDRAIEAGAVAVVGTEAGAMEAAGGRHPDVVFITVADSADSLAIAATVFYDEPSKELTLIGVTGTNGKTTVTTLLHDLFTKLGYKAGLLSTVEVRIGTEVETATHTTPDAVAINAHLSDMRDAGCDFCFMEVSSHAVHQRRTAGLDFNGGVFTNLTHDHLDYHKTFREYLEAKKTFFTDLPGPAFALTNADDKNGTVMVQNTPGYQAALFPP